MTPPEIAAQLRALQEKVADIGKAITAAYWGSAEHGSFCYLSSGQRAEYCPSAFLTLEELKKQVADLLTGVEAHPSGKVGVESHPLITRLEVIDETGRAYSQWNCEIQLSVQDGGRTLKVFVEPRPTRAPEAP